MDSIDRAGNTHSQLTAVVSWLGFVDSDDHAEFTEISITLRHPLGTTRLMAMRSRVTTYNHAPPWTTAGADVHHGNDVRIF